MIETKDGKRIVVSADDFGISKLANVRILEGVRKGLIDRVEVMMSENVDEEEVRELKRSGIKLDIHLHLIRHDSDYWQGDRNLKERTAKQLLGFAFNYLTGRKSAGKTRLQWAIQIERFRELFGQDPEGIGSHEYIHFFPPYLKAVLELSDRYGIPYVRIGRSDLGLDSPKARILDLLRQANMRRHFRERSAATSDYMVSFDWIDDWDKFVERLPAGTETEVIFHPEREEEAAFIEKTLSRYVSD